MAEKSDIPKWRRLLGAGAPSTLSDGPWKPSKWSMGVLNDKDTIEVPGFPVSSRRNSASSATNRPQVREEKKKTSDGAIILEPQPEDSANDPLNWPSWRRDVALLSLGFYCMIGGGTTPLVAAGFTDIAETYSVDVERVSLTTGLYMMGMGLGSVIFSPTAILWGKRPVYLASSILFIGTSLWAAWSPSFNSLLAARVFQGVAVSPVECLPSATIAEIFFLHERAYRIGIYTLLLLGGKNLVPLVSAAIIGRVLAMIIGLGAVLLFLFVPETFWDRTPHAKPRVPSKRPSFLRRLSSRHRTQDTGEEVLYASPNAVLGTGHGSEGQQLASPGPSHRHRNLHVGFANAKDDSPEAFASEESTATVIHPSPSKAANRLSHEPAQSATPYFSSATGSESNVASFKSGPNLESEKMDASRLSEPLRIQAYTHNLRQQPARTFSQQLKPWHGRLNHDSWLKVMVRPFILYAYPAVLWSSAVYACSVGWLIVISESIAMIYRNRESYDFDALQTGLVYVSPFVGGILGTGVAGKVSDIIVKAMARRNGGLYEPEFRLVMAVPILISTCIGLMGFGWSAEEKNHWIVPTVFFGIVSFGCSLGSTTAITFCVDSYRQYAGEALVTLNFSKNVLHGLVFSLFVTHWLHSEGPKMVYIWIGIIQLILMLGTIPMYIYGKRARMWTVRANLMERF
ncbi:hypothetical protein N0V84_005553 [Fusarium piperis]|uniref:Major facilitator superfamily (MFS) profile domain-containing protein n=1 Tax=Fusarium piperis TaxID=1435070 RepID=A0A9W9BP65_9HYPO|nr:hypothetical protein N0V84_005553 [Fusarium piperis]